MLSGTRQRRTFVVATAAAAWAAVVSTRPAVCDFASFYAAGSLLRTNPQSLYSLAAQAAAERAVGQTYLMPWLHPAPEALLFVPLSLLPYAAAFAIWTAFSMVCLGLAVWLMRPELRPLPAEAHYGLLAFGLPPLVAGLQTGQDHCLFLLLLVASYHQLQRGALVAAGVWLGLALIRYQFVLPVLLLLATMRVWRVLGSVLVVGIALVIVSVVCVGPRLFGTYRIAIAFLAGTHDGITVGALPTVRGLLSHIATAHSVPVLLLIEALLLGWAMSRARRMRPTDGFLFALPVAMLLDYHGFGYELVVLILPFAVLLKYEPRLLWLLAGMFACHLAAANVSVGFESCVAVFLIASLPEFGKLAHVGRNQNGYTAVTMGASAA